MATTTAFGWETPDDTDLVKDGAAAIRTLGSSIDTSMAELKGGTTGQVLSKTSATDMDFTWVTQDDANAIQNTQLTAKGALITAFSSATPATLTVGSNYDVLSAQSGQATGLQWAGTPVAFTPTWTTDVGSPAIGNGTMTMSYIRYGKFIQIQFIWQAGGTTTFGTSGTFFWSLPFTAKTGSLNSACGGGFYGEDYAIAAYAGLPGLTSDGTKMFIKSPALNQSTWGKTTPITWGVTDYISGVFNYEVA